MLHRLEAFSWEVERDRCLLTGGMDAGFSALWEHSCPQNEWVMAALSGTVCWVAVELRPDFRLCIRR